MNIVSRVLPVFFALVIGSAPVLSAADEDIGALFTSITAPSGLDAKAIQEVVAYSLAARSWQVKENTPARVIGYLNHRGHEATVTFMIREGGTDMHCVGYAVKKDGTRKKPALPEGWLRNLEKDINKRLNIKAVTQ